MSEITENVLDCPKCNKPMRQLKAGDAVADRCEACLGLWLDKGERRKLLKDKSLVAGIDIGSPDKGAEHDEITEVDCPRCHVRLHHVHDKAQKHIGFEACEKCEGIFLDAGELTDLSEFTLSERIKALFGQ